MSLDSACVGKWLMFVLEGYRFVEGGNIAKNNNDHLWHGKALEGIGICLAILVHLKVDFQVCSLGYLATFLLM